MPSRRAPVRPAARSARTTGRRSGPAHPAGLRVRPAARAAALIGGTAAEAHRQKHAPAVRPPRSKAHTVTSTAPAKTAGTVPRPEARRRVLRVLVASQVLSGAGLAAGITVGALLAQDMLGSTDLAGLPSALFTAGSALAAVAVGRMSQARGRRPGLAAGYLTGAVGSAGVIAAAVADTPVLLFVALFVYGAGTATNLQARYAGADLAAPRPPRPRRLHRPGHHHPRRRRRSQPRRSHRGPRGNPPHTRLAGPFLLAGAAYALAALVLVVWRARPAAARPRSRPPAAGGGRRGGGRGRRRPARTQRGPGPSRAHSP
ncbi:hypothetical protein SGRIM128S_08750 [Streptomyces griseomycini]